MLTAARVSSPGTRLGDRGTPFANSAPDAPQAPAVSRLRYRCLLVSVPERAGAGGACRAASSNAGAARCYVGATFGESRPASGARDRPGPRQPADDAGAEAPS